MARFLAALPHPQKKKNMFLTHFISQACIADVFSSRLGFIRRNENSGQASELDFFGPTYIVVLIQLLTCLFVVPNGLYFVNRVKTQLNFVRSFKHHCGRRGVVLNTGASTTLERVGGGVISLKLFLNHLSPRGLVIP